MTKTSIRHGAGGLCILALTLLTSASMAQEQGGRCCHERQCTPIANPDAELKKGAGESYTVTATGEIFYPPDWSSEGADPGTSGGMSTRAGKTYRWSEDGEFRRCGTSTTTYCLIIPRPGA